MSRVVGAGRMHEGGVHQGVTRKVCERIGRGQPGGQELMGGLGTSGPWVVGHRVVDG